VTTSFIERKRDGEHLTADEWSRLIRDYVGGRVPDYQMSALLMAVYFNGLDGAELNAVTDAMLQSGGRLEFERGMAVVDKHSTGGVGDKVSLVLAPLVACTGVAVPMMSGRGLGHTGGTLDKLEAIPGFRTDLSLDAVRRQVLDIGCAMFGQTREVAPADQKLYALRDVTGTVEAIPLIAASIMSKKLAEGLTGLVLDVKRGSGAFIPELPRGLELARTMVSLGEARSCPTVALLTAMDRPLGHACGNALETEEALLALRGEGPEDLMEVTYALGIEMLMVAGHSKDREAARTELRGAIESGRAAEKAQEIIEAQGGTPAVVDDPALLPQAPLERVVCACTEGVVQEVEPRRIGHAIVAMGGGRRTIDDTPDLSVGFCITARPGARVNRDTPLATIYARDDDGLDLGEQALRDAIRIDEETFVEPAPLISHRVSAAGVEEIG
jgi:pyrimidine-nucleoside phosphorylase